VRGGGAGREGGVLRGRAGRLGLAAAAAAAAAALVLGLVAPPYGAASAPAPADAALVLSGDVDCLRAAKAAALYRDGRVRFVLVTGAGVGGDSAAVLRQALLRAGVPDAAIVVETRSTTTRENLALAAPLVRGRGWRRLALVTSASHMGRALAVARRALPEVEWLAVPARDAGPAGRRFRQRLAEWGKLAGYWLRGWV